MLMISGHHCEIYTLPKKANREALTRWTATVLKNNPKLIVTVGAKSTKHILAATPNTPIVFTMVPNVLDASFIKTGNQRHRITGISSDASPQRRIRWVTRTGNALRRVVILYSDATKRTVASLQVVASQFGIEIVDIKATKDTFMEALSSVERADCDGVLMILDANVYNSPTIRALLVWGARNRKPVWSFSKNFVKAGAFAGQFFNPDGLGRQTARVVLKILQGQSPGDIDIQYVEALDTAINLHTSSMIDLQVPLATLPPNTVRYGDNQ